MIGTNAGYNSIGERNVFIGIYAGYNETGSNKLYVDTSTTSAPLIYGEFDNDLVRVNGALDVTGTFSAQNVINTPFGYQIGGVQVIKADNDNTYIGRDAGQGASGVGNVFIGYQAGLNEAGNYKLYVSNSSTAAPLIYGEFNTGFVEVNGDLYVTGNTYVDSDKTLKKDMQPIESSLDKILDIEGVTYTWKNEESDIRHYGVIAQQVEKVLPEIVRGGQDDKKKVAYMELIPVLIEAMKEQQELIKNQTRTIKGLNRRISILEDKLSPGETLALAETE